MDMNRTLHDTNNAQRILKLTADTMLLVDKNGVCIDIDPHCDLWFLQDEILLGKNIFELLPEYTRERVVPVFQSVLEGKKSVSKNFKLVLKEDVYYFKCIMHPYDDMVLCQYRDITQRSNVKRQLEQANRTLREIQKVAQIGQWCTIRMKTFFIIWDIPACCAKKRYEAFLSRNTGSISLKKTGRRLSTGNLEIWRGSIRTVSATAYR